MPLWLLAGSYAEFAAVRQVLSTVVRLQCNVSPAQLDELEQAEDWIDTQAMLAELEEQEERLQMASH